MEQTSFLFQQASKVCVCITFLVLKISKFYAYLCVSSISLFAIFCFMGCFLEFCKQKFCTPGTDHLNTSRQQNILYFVLCIDGHSYYSLPENAIYVIQVGFSHKNILRTIVHHACLRFPNLAPVSVISNKIPNKSKYSELHKSFPLREGAQNVFVIFGGNTSERQVSLMSGTNVWLNLLAFSDVSVHLLKSNYVFQL